MPIPDSEVDFWSHLSPSEKERHVKTHPRPLNLHSPGPGRKLCSCPHTLDFVSDGRSDRRPWHNLHFKELACDYQLAEADWYPGSFDMSARGLSPEERITLQQSAVNSKKKVWFAVDLFCHPGMRQEQYLNGVHWPCPNMQLDLVHIFKNCFRSTLLDQGTTLLVHTGNAHDIIS